MGRTPSIDDLVPLRPVPFAVLLALSGEPLHGYAIMQQVNETMGSRAIIGPGTLYRTLKELRGKRLIEHAKGPRGSTDERRQYYRLTGLGRRVAATEAERMAGLVSQAKSYRLIPDRGGR